MHDKHTFARPEWKAPAYPTRSWDDVAEEAVELLIVKVSRDVNLEHPEKIAQGY
jgi:hypothetical protein